MMHTLIRKVFLEEPRLRWAAFRYGVLALIFALTLFAAIAAAHLSPSARGRYFGYIVPPMLLLSHLAFQFRWPPLVKVGLRIAAILCCGIGLAYTFLVAVMK
jgi:hypothetical protein